MHFSKRTIQAQVLAMLFVFSSANTALAVEDLGNGWGPQPLEIAQLPAYCHKQFLTNDTGAIYKEFSGCDGIHHMCPGLVLINRAGNIAIPKGERKRILNQAKNEIGYVATRLMPSCTATPVVRAAESRIRILETFLK